MKQTNSKFIRVTKEELEKFYSKLPKKNSNTQISEQPKKDQANVTPDLGK